MAKVKGWAVVNYNDYTKEYTVQLWPHETKTAGYYALCEVEVEVELPPQTVMQQRLIAGWRKYQEELRAEAQGKVTQVDQLINNTLCLEYKPESDDGNR